MRKFLFLSFLLTVGLNCLANLKVVVLEPVISGAMDNQGTKIAVRELIDNGINKSGVCDVIDRSVVDAIIKDQNLSGQNDIDEKTAARIALLAGADKAILPSITQTGSQNLFRLKLIDVKTKATEKQQVKIGTDSEIFSSVEPLSIALVNGDSGDTTQYSNTSGTSSQQSSGASLPQIAPGELLITLLPYPGETEGRELEGRVLKVKVDGERVGKLNIGEGGSIRLMKRRLKDKKDGMHTLQVGNYSMKFHEDDYNYFEFSSDSSVAGKYDVSGKIVKGVMPDLGRGERPRYEFTIFLKDNKLIK